MVIKLWQLTAKVKSYCKMTLLSPEAKAGGLNLNEIFYWR